MKISTFIFSLLISILHLNSFAQPAKNAKNAGNVYSPNQQLFVNMQEHVFKDIHVHDLAIVDSTDIFTADSSSKSRFYYAIKPLGEIKGTLVLFSGTMETPADVLNNNTSFAELAHDNNLMLIIPSVNSNLFLNTVTLNFINSTLSDAIAYYKLNTQKFVFGGFSLGGMTALRYTELSVEDKNKTVVHPLAVYAIDSPLDYSRLYSSFSSIAATNFSEGSAYEARYYLQKMNAQFGGTPNTNKKNYVSNSILDHSLITKCWPVYGAQIRLVA